MIGKRLKNLREQHKLTQGELAEKIGVGQRTVAFYEKNEKQPAYEKLLKIATLFNVTTDYLLGNSTQDIIQRRIEELKLSPEIVAQKTGVSVQFINNLSNNTPENESDYEPILKITKFLGLHPTHVLQAYTKQEAPLDEEEQTTSAVEDFKDQTDGIQKKYKYLIEKAIFSNVSLEKLDKIIDILKNE